jgi:hypothetical protein
MQAADTKGAGRIDSFKHKQTVKKAYNKYMKRGRAVQVSRPKGVKAMVEKRKVEVFVAG